MSEEQLEKNYYFHHSTVKMFAITALGSFVGIFCALCLFCAIHKDPIVVNSYPIYHQEYGFSCPYHKKMMRKIMKKQIEDFKKDFEDFKQDID